MKYTFLFIPLLLLSCQGSQADVKVLADLSYREVIELVFEKAAGNPIEWHGEALDLSAQEELEITQNGNCGDRDCGQNVLLQNKSEQTIEVSLQIEHTLASIHPYFARKVQIAPSAQVEIGCSKICLNEEVRPCSYKIVGAKYLN